MSERPTFEAQLAAALTAYADRAPVEVDAVVLTTITARTSAARSRGFLALPDSRLVPILLGLVLVGLVGATVVIGAALLERVDRPLDLPSVVDITPAPEESTEAPAVIVTSPAPDATTPGDEPAAIGPCPRMAQILQTWAGAGDPGPLPAGPPARTAGAGDIVFTTTGAQVDGGNVGSARIDPSADTLSLVTGDAAVERRFPSLWAFPHHPQSRMAASPDGRALAVEEGDLGQAGCGDPLVLLADGGALRPFPVGAFEIVSDLAWAPDGSALYGVRRPTVDGQGRPYFDRDAGQVLDGPGVVVRWDTSSREVTTLEGSCGSCGQLYVSPDGRFVATSSPEGNVFVHEPETGWRSITLGEPDGLVGWADAETLVLNGRRVVLDGTTRSSWDAPCCHGTGFGGPLSPDGSTIAGMTLSSDMGSWRVTLLDTMDGSAREIWDPAATPGGGRAPSGYARVAAWAPDGSAVVVIEPTLDSTSATLWVVATDGSGRTKSIDVVVPDMAATLGFPNIGPSVVWLPGME
jgi:hypothetical protein